MGFIGLIRLIALLLAVWLVWRFIARKKTNGTTQADAQIDQKVVQCAVCATHVPQAEALSKDEEWYCSSEHLEQAQKTNEPDD